CLQSLEFPPFTF
nr:immunoglobulin light chain junction region [Macaca mulatta]